jgi:hypothetical protein
MSTDDLALDTVVATARALLGAVTSDDSGMLIGNQWVGGNGGLLSRDTLRVADQLRLALDAHDQAVAAQREVEVVNG